MMQVGPLDKTREPFGGPADAEFAAAVEAIYAAAMNQALWPAALQKVADCFGAAGGSLIWPRSDGKVGRIASPGIAEALKDYETNAWPQRDPRAIRFAEKGYYFSGEPCTDRHLCSERVNLCLVGQFLIACA